LGGLGWFASGAMPGGYCALPGLAIREGLSAFYFHSIKGKDLPVLYRAVELVQQGRDLTPLYEVLERYGGNEHDDSNSAKLAHVLTSGHELDNPLL
jgi:hypothetical protein